MGPFYGLYRLDRMVSHINEQEQWAKFANLKLTQTRKPALADRKTAPKKVAAIGLGSMGYGIAVSALRGGHEVWGVDINAEQMARFQAEGGRKEPVGVTERIRE